MSILPLVLLVASWLHPGAETKHRPFLEAVARQAPDPLTAVVMLVYAERESRFGDALSGHRWDAAARGILQVRGRPDLETNEVGSVDAWLHILERSRRACGDELALAGLSSGACNRGTRLASERAAEAGWYLMAAQLVLASQAGAGDLPEVRR